MVKIESNKSTLNASTQVVFDYLSVPQNYKILMPSKVRSFEATAESATLDIEGIGKVELAITERVSPSKIVMLPQNKVPFKFDIQWNIVTQGEGTEVQAVVNAELNFMMKMIKIKIIMMMN